MTPNRDDRDRYVHLITYHPSLERGSGSVAARRVQPARLIKDYAPDGSCTRIREQRIRWRDVRDGREPWPREAIAYLRERAAEYNRCAQIGDGVLHPKKRVGDEWVDDLPTQEALTEAG